MDAVIRGLVSSMPNSSLECSLHRSSKLGREVLERAKRRSVDWSSGRFSKKSNAAQNHCKIQDDAAVHARLDQAFTKIVEYMSETTNQCRMFYESEKTGAVSSEREQTHVCRFHSRQLAWMSQHPQAGVGPTKQVLFTGLSEPEDFLIEVSPGTYAISAAAQDAGPQTKVVRVGAGESMRLTFNL